MTLGAIVLCGGRSTRMGRDKASLPFGRATMLQHIVDLLRDMASEVIVVTRPDQAMPADVRVVHDDLPDQGPLAGLAAGLAASKADVNVVVACDMPLVKPAVLARLVDLLGEHDLCVADVDGRPSVLCGVYRRRVAETARRLLAAGERRVTALLDHAHVKRVEAAALRDLDPSLDSFLSCDTPEAYQRALIKTGSAIPRSPDA